MTCQRYAAHKKTTSIYKHVDPYRRSSEQHLLVSWSFRATGQECRTGAAGCSCLAVSSALETEFGAGKCCHIHCEPCEVLVGNDACTYCFQALTAHARCIFQQHNDPPRGVRHHGIKLRRVLQSPTPLVHDFADEESLMKHRSYDHSQAADLNSPYPVPATTSSETPSEPAEARMQRQAIRTGIKTPPMVTLNMQPQKDLMLLPTVAGFRSAGISRSRNHPSRGAHERPQSRARPSTPESEDGGKNKAIASLLEAQVDSQLARGRNPAQRSEFHDEKSTATDALFDNSQQE